MKQLLDSLVEEYMGWLDSGPRRKMSFTAWLRYTSVHYQNERAKEALTLLNAK